MCIFWYSGGGVNDELRAERLEQLANKARDNYQNVMNNKLTSRDCLCLFPCGIGSKTLINFLINRGIIPDYISDNDERKLTGSIEGIPCITVDALWEKHNNDVTILVESLYYNEIKTGLQKKGFTDIQRIYVGKEAAANWVNDNAEILLSSCKSLLHILEDERSKIVAETIISSWLMEDVPDNYFAKIYDKDQYFDTDIVRLSKEECFVDCGAYTGDTTDELLRHIPDFKGNIYQFELDPTIYNVLCKNMTRYENKITIKSFPFGNSKADMEVKIGSGNRNSCILTDDETEEFLKGNVVALDNILKSEKITFIKMDIEGSEWDALHGAKHIIQNQKPKLAICLYHKPEDMFRIPMYLKELVPAYKIYLRHYTDMLWETVCYAV